RGVLLLSRGDGVVLARARRGLAHRDRSGRARRAPLGGEQQPQEPGAGADRVPSLAVPLLRPATRAGPRGGGVDAALREEPRPRAARRAARARGPAPARALGRAARAARLAPARLP